VVLDKRFKRMRETDVKRLVKGTELEGKFVAADVAEAVTKLDEVLNTPSEMKGMIRFFDRANSTYRGLVTQLFPGFHARNHLSNWFMMGLAGMRPGDLRFVTKAAGIQRRLAKGTATKADKLAMRNAAEFASLGSSFTREATIGLDEKDVAQRLIQFGGKVATAGIGAHNVEDNAKLAMYLWGVNKGMTKQESGQLVKRFLFDYQDLSQFESKFLRRMAYFYTFARKSIPVIIEEIYMNPRRLRAYGLATGQVGSRRGEREILPPWLKDRDAFDFGLDDDGKRVFRSFGLPTEQVTQFSTQGRGPGRSLERLLGFAAPGIQFPLSIATGRDFRLGRDVGRPPDPTAARSGEELAFTLDKLARLAPISRIVTSAEQAADLLDSDSKRSTADTLGGLATGVFTSRIDPTDAKLNNRLRELERSQEILQSLGRARTFRGFFGDDELRRRISSEMARIRRERAKRR